MRKGDRLLSNLYLTPAFLIYSGFVVIPIILTLYYSLTNWTGVGKATFIWFMNFVEMAGDADYWVITKNTFVLVAFSLIVQIPVALLLAFVVSRIGGGYRFYRSVYFLPVVISAAATALMFSLIFNSQVGPLNYILQSVGLGSLKRNWLSDKHTVLYVVAFSQVWQYIGIYFIVFLAAIQSIPEEILESAYLDGASNARVIASIMLPLLWEVFQISIIMVVTGCLKAFDHSWIMTWGGPGIASSYLPVYVYRKAFKEFAFSYACTIAISIIIYSLIFTVVFRRLSAREEVQY